MVAPRRVAPRRVAPAPRRTVARRTPKRHILGPSALVWTISRSPRMKKAQRLRWTKNPNIKNEQFCCPRSKRLYLNDLLVYLGILKRILILSRDNQQPSQQNGVLHHH